jgi:UDP:flavonoid glycosyltransferase YjiC (YdhE family)
VIPVDYDQPDIAARLVHHDLAERLHPSDLRGEAGARRLADAVGRALRPSPDRNAALLRFRAACARDDGATGAADVIEEALADAPAARHPTGDEPTGAHA